MWGRNAEVAEKYIRKGSRLYIEGRLRTRNWEDKNKIKRYITEIYVDSFEMLGGGQRSSDVAQPSQPVDQVDQQANVTQDGDQVPF